LVQFLKNKNIIDIQCQDLLNIREMTSF
jgi:hypothetical protein